LERLVIALCRQPLLQIAVHDAQSCRVNRFEPPGHPQTEDYPARERQQNGGHDPDHERLENHLPEGIDFIETPAEQNNAIVLPAAGDEDSRFGFGIRTLKRSRLDDVRRAIDGEVLRYRRDVAVL
jgi:hypothetical protein